MEKTFIDKISSVANTCTINFHVTMTDGQIYSVAWVDSSWNIMPMKVMSKGKLIDAWGNNSCLGTSIMSIDDVKSVVWLLANSHINFYEIDNMSKYKLNKILQITD